MECMSFNQLFMIPQSLLTTSASTTDHHHHHIQHDVTKDADATAAACSQPGAEWEPAINLLLALGMIVMILVSVLSAYMEAMLYLKSQQASSSSTSSAHNCKPMSSTTSDKKSSNIYAPMFQNLTNVRASPPPPLPAFDSEEFETTSQGGRGDDFKKLRGKKAAKKLKKSKKESQTSESNPIVEAVNSSHIEQLTVMLKHQPTNTTTTTVCSSSTSSSKAASLPAAPLVSSAKSNCKPIGSTTSDKKSSNIYAPMFQNLTNVIASPPPPLPAFDSEEFETTSQGGRGDDFKKLRGKKAAKKSKKSKKESQTSESNSIVETDNSAHIEQLTVMLKHQPTNTTTTTVCSSSPSSSKASSLSAASLVSSTKSSASSSSSTSSTASSPASSIAPSSTSSSPPLSASSYGEYSLLGPGVTFELPCLRVRSAQI